MVDPKQLIDITLLGKYDELLKGVITSKETEINTKIGELPDGNDDVISYINAQIEGVQGDASTLEGRVKANEDAIGKKAEGEQAATGLYLYTDNAAKKAVDDIVGGASEDFDTLKEAETWIGEHESVAAQMQIDITALQGSEADNETANSIVGAKKYADKAVADKNVSAVGETGEAALVEADAAANKVTVNSTKKLKDAVALAETSVQSVGKATSVENFVEMTVVDGDDATVAISDAKLVEKIGAASATAPTGMYADIQGATSATVADVNDKVDALQLASEAQVKALFGL